MKVYIEKTNEYKEAKGKTVAEILTYIKINPTTIIVIKNGQLVTETEKVMEKDEIKLLSVISGG